MSGNNVLGLIFTYTAGGAGITCGINTGALPFGAKYRVIDFPLSNMVNAGIKKVGIITDDNYGQLMKHVGSGEEWGLSHKRQGLYILPPYGAEPGCENSWIKSLDIAKGFLTKSKEEYVLLSNSETICNIDYKRLFSQHESNGADITLVCRYDRIPENMRSPLIITIDPNMRVQDMGFCPPMFNKACYSLGMMLIRRKLLIELVADCVSRNLCNFKSDLLMRNFSMLKTYAYMFCGFSESICSEKDYFEANMSMLNVSLRHRLFACGRPIYTNISDDMPTQYSGGCKTANSLIGGGCIIEGQVENSLLFNGVHIEQGASVKNCIIMGGSKIKGGCHLNCAIACNEKNPWNSFSNLKVHHFPILSFFPVQNGKTAKSIQDSIGAT